MNYARSLLRNRDYYPEENESIIDKWLNYKRDRRPDLDTYLEDYYKMVWPNLTKDICIRRDTMTSPLVTFEEYAYFKGFEWKAPNAYGMITFTNFMKENRQDRDSRLGSKLEEFIELATSLCNMIPVPQSFNTGRSGPYAKWDYWDLTLIQLKKWYDYKLCNNEIGMKDALRLLFAHSTHRYVFNIRSTSMFDSIHYTEKWLEKFENWNQFIEAMYLDNFVDKENGWKPVLFWDTHSHELPLPTDTEYDIDAVEERNEQINKNFEQFFERVNGMLKGRAKLLFDNFH